MQNGAGCEAGSRAVARLSVGIQVNEHLLCLVHCILIAIGKLVFSRQLSSMDVMPWNKLQLW